MNKRHLKRYEIVMNAYGKYEVYFVYRLFYFLETKELQFFEKSTKQYLEELETEHQFDKGFFVSKEGHTFSTLQAAKDFAVVKIHQMGLNTEDYLEQKQKEEEAKSPEAIKYKAEVNEDFYVD